MKREYYSASIVDFQNTESDSILGALTRNNPFALDSTQLSAWLEEISILQKALADREGRIYFEYAIPRMGKRIDVVVLIGPVIFVLEFKVGESTFSTSALDQVCDYALDLKNFHESSYNHFIAPILIPTSAQRVEPTVYSTPQNDKLFSPIRCTVALLGKVIDDVLHHAENEADIDPELWENGRYCPTPTIIEAALALYKGHSVSEISRNDAEAINLTLTSEAIAAVIKSSKEKSHKSICFVTGVPGAGKTLVGLDTATKHRDEQDSFYSVFLSGNGPLVAILREALAQDHVENEKKHKRKVRKGEARSKVRAFIQPVHHFRDECLKDLHRPPIEHVALFDEAQRAWNLQQTRKFMRGVRRKEKVLDFNQSEPEFLISCLNRHPDWAVIVCLVGGGQEINTGEAGISEWIRSLNRTFSDWRIHISSRLTDSEYGAGKVLEELSARPHVTINENLHLAVSMRSFRAENVSRLVKELLDLEAQNARRTLSDLNAKYPIVITRDLAKAKQWLRRQARGSERYGIVVSSQAERLKPHAIDVKTKVNPVHWFLHGKEDVRSSYYLEDVATEFSVQGLELDWACVTWDADFRHAPEGWQHWSFSGVRWNHIKKTERKTYLKNAYRVLMTRARQGMVIVVPPGDVDDPTRKPEFYDPTFEYLREVGFTTI
jgi:hypothetical protein